MIRPQQSVHDLTPEGRATLGEGRATPERRATPEEYAPPSGKIVDLLVEGCHRTGRCRGVRETTCVFPRGTVLLFMTDEASF